MININKGFVDKSDSNQFFQFDTDEFQLVNFKEEFEDITEEQKTEFLEEQKELGKTRPFNLGPNRLIVRDMTDNRIYYVKRLIFSHEDRVISCLKFFNRIIKVTEDTKDYLNPVKL